MAAVSAISFSLFNFVGDPVNNMVGQDATREQRVEIRQQLGLDDPVLTQYTRFIGNVLQGDFGVSLPTFIIGIALIYLFAVHLRWLPSSGRSGTIDLGFWKTSLLSVDGWRAIVLPAITLSLFQLTMILRLVRAEMLEVMRADYIKFARARGLAERTIYFVHALRNTLVPVITVIGLNIGGLIAYSVITETVFQWPGTGLMFIQAVDFVDVPIMAAYLIFVALLFVVINLIVDILYFVVDPRIRLGGS